ncbi:alpha/beta fold hydrolase [Alkalihalophilus sp. As8PL]|uniref:Alpha/beta fold hydrolase n=1 Tax=Alkalihalophilus sp. As8PL TaxID=3237103 RepID=A0AB39BPV2_9BACI
MAYASYKGMNVFYEVRGRGIPLLFIHPPGMSRLTFRYQHSLSDTGQVVVLDLPGNGHSIDGVSRALSVGEQAECVRAVLKKIRAKKAVVIGYSTGGSVAQEFALRYPELTNGIVLIGGFPEVSSFLLDKEFKLGIWAAKKKWMSLIGYAVAKVHFKNKEHEKEMQRAMKEVDPDILSESYRFGHKYQSIERLNQVTMPLLLLYGKFDILTHNYIYDFVKRAHDVEVISIQGVLHQVPTKKYNECNHAIREWLKRRQLV